MTSNIIEQVGEVVVIAIEGVAFRRWLPWVLRVPLRPRDHEAGVAIRVEDASES